MTVIVDSMHRQIIKIHNHVVQKLIYEEELKK